MLSRFLTSSSTGNAFRPRASISALKGMRDSGLRLVITRSAPARASARPKYCPSPRLVPVTMATLPVRSNVLSLIFLSSFLHVITLHPSRPQHHLQQPRLLAIEPVKPH